MKWTLSIFLSFLIISTHVQAQANSCESPKRFSELLLWEDADEEVRKLNRDILEKNWAKYDQSTANWAMEFSGTDLVDSLLSEKSKSLKKASVAVLDVGFEGYLDFDQRNIIKLETEDKDNHGTFVSNIIADSGKLADIKFLLGNPSNDEFSEVTQLFEEHGYPCLMNNSQLNYLDEGFQPQLKKWLDNNMVFVGSGGNTFPGTPSSIPALTKDLIITGWLDNDGLYHADSAVGKHITLVAPSGESMMVKGSANEYSFFGGSSGSAPHVSGTVANLIATLGTNEIEIIKNILERSALPFPLKSDENGAGSLNSYKAINVAFRLKETCGKDINCLKIKSLEKETYDFTKNEFLSRSVKSSMLQTCKKGDTCSIGGAIDSVREEFFLTQNKEAAEILSCYYESLKFPGNARFYKLYGGLEKLESYIVNLPDDKAFLRHAIYLENYPEERFSKVLNQMVESTTKENFDQFIIGKLILNAKKTKNPVKYLPQLLKLFAFVDETIESAQQDSNGNETEQVYRLDYWNFPSLLSGDVLSNEILKWLIQNKTLGKANIQHLLCFEMRKFPGTKPFTRELEAKKVDLTGFKGCSSPK